MGFGVKSGTKVNRLNVVVRKRGSKEGLKRIGKNGSITAQELNV